MFQHFTKYLIIFISLSSATLFAQNELGNPYIKNYSPKEYGGGSTIWGIAQDNEGIMYFGVSEGVLQYDGSNWQNIKVDNGTTCRAMDVDADGRVYVGAKNEFGYLGEDSLRRPTYISLSNQLEEKYQDFADVWNVYVTNEGVFFLTFKRIYQWHEGKITVHEHDDITAHLGFYVQDKMYLVLLRNGLHVFENDRFVPVPGGMYFTQKTIFGILPFDEDNILVASRKDGLELLNTKTGEVVPFENDVNEELIKNKTYHATISENGEFVFATLKHGIYVLDRNGELVMHINQENGLQNDNVKYVFKDKFGGLWAGTAIGISHIDLNLPLTFFTPDNGFKGYPRSMIRDNGILYAATGNSIFWLDEAEQNRAERWKAVPQADDQFWDFLKVGEHLLVGSSKGLYELKGTNLFKIQDFKSNALFNMARSHIDTDRIYLSLKNGLAIAELTENGNVEVVHQFEDYDVEGHHIAEDVEGNVWVSTAFEFIVKIEAESFNKEKGYPLSFKKIEYIEKIASEEILTWKGQVLFTSSEGLLTIGEDLIPKPFKGLKIEGFPEEANIRRFKEDAAGNLWIHFHYGKNNGQLLALKKEDGNFKVKEDPFTRIGEKISHSGQAYVEADGVTWFFGGEAIVRYDYKKDLQQRKDYYVNIRKFSMKGDSIVVFGNNIDLDIANFTYAFKNNATSFSFSAASYGNEKENKYQYYLEGNDEDWSEWMASSVKEYNYLHEGAYTFRVRAKNVYNQISQEDQFSFVVLPPWYREKWAYTVYVLCFIFLLYFIVRLATYRLSRAKKQLEELVKDRTKDIRIEKEKVEVQKLELENIHQELSERNKDVMDSIKYAQHIQSSILPPLQKFKDEFEESFIYYQPRDIVSGDFYWFGKRGDYFTVACADCTGHGVPGAFMSMISATLLNKITEKGDVDSCQMALMELDKEMHKALRQEKSGSENNSMDGMDLALIAVNLKEMVCHYSGAYRPLYMIRDNELVVYNSNRMSIGGGIVKEKEFKGENINIKRGDQLYMFTDGYTDQFGGEKNKKFKRDRLKNLLLKYCNESMDIQHQKIANTFEDWKGDNEQIDDVLLMGIRIS